MAAGARIAGVRGEVDAEALARREVAFRVDALRLFLSEAALKLLVPPGKPLAIQRVTGGRLFLRLVWSGPDVTVEALPRVSSQGRLRLEPTAFRAGFLPLPTAVLSALLGFVRERLSGLPGLHLSQDNVVEIDLGEILRSKVPGVSLPPLYNVRVSEGAVELEYLRSTRESGV